MYARRTTTKAAPEQRETARRVIEEVIPSIQGLPGFRGGYWLSDAETGAGLTFTFFDSEEHLAESADIAAKVRAEATQEIGAQILAVDEFEVAVHTGDKVHRSAACARVATLQGQSGRIDEVITTIQDVVLPAAKQLPGFLGGFWLVDRATTQGVGVTLFDSAENIAASRDTANQIRDRAAVQAGAQVSQFAEYEVLARAKPPAAG